MEIRKLKLVKANFEMNDLGVAKKIIGMEIVRNMSSKVVQLCQKHF